MHTSCRVAFKEWAVIVEALKLGAQSVILRKGGIHEEQGVFRIKHESFLLFPTHEHQSAEDLDPSFRAGSHFLLQPKPVESNILISLFAQVEKVFRIGHEEQIERLSPFHVWTDAVIRRRFHYGKEKGLFLILIRAFRVRPAVDIPLLPRYAGCRSWVDLAAPILLEHASPVLAEEAFARLAVDISAALRTR